MVLFSLKQGEKLTKEGVDKLLQLLAMTSQQNIVCIRDNVAADYTRCSTTPSSRIVDSGIIGGKYPLTNLGLVVNEMDSRALSKQYARAITTNCSTYRASSKGGAV